jgi:hypothetical protein
MRIPIKGNSSRPDGQILLFIFVFRNRCISLSVIRMRIQFTLDVVAAVLHVQ